MARQILYHDKLSEKAKVSVTTFELIKTQITYSTIHLDKDCEELKIHQCLIESIESLRLDKSKTSDHTVKRSENNLTQAETESLNILTKFYHKKKNLIIADDAYSNYPALMMVFITESFVQFPSQDPFLIICHPCRVVEWYQACSALSAKEFRWIFITEDIYRVDSMEISQAIRSSHIVIVVKSNFNSSCSCILDQNYSSRIFDGNTKLLTIDRAYLSQGWNLIKNLKSHKILLLDTFVHLNWSGCRVENTANFQEAIKEIRDIESLQMFDKFKQFSAMTRQVHESLENLHYIVPIFMSTAQKAFLIRLMDKFVDKSLTERDLSKLLENPSLIWDKSGLGQEDLTLLKELSFHSLKYDLIARIAGAINCLVKENKRFLVIADKSDKQFLQNIDTENKMVLIDKDELINGSWREDDWAAIFVVKVFSLSRNWLRLIDSLVYRLKKKTTFFHFYYQDSYEEFALANMSQRSLSVNEKFVEKSNMDILVYSFYLFLNSRENARLTKILSTEEFKKNISSLCNGGVEADNTFDDHVKKIMKIITEPDAEAKAGIRSLFSTTHTCESILTFYATILSRINLEIYTSSNSHEYIKCRGSNTLFPRLELKDFYYNCDHVVCVICGIYSKSKKVIPLNRLLYQKLLLNMDILKDTDWPKFVKMIEPLSMNFKLLAEIYNPVVHTDCKSLFISRYSKSSERRSVSVRSCRNSITQLTSSANSQMAKKQAFPKKTLITEKNIFAPKEVATKKVSTSNSASESPKRIGLKMNPPNENQENEDEIMEYTNLKSQLFYPDNLRIKEWNRMVKYNFPDKIVTWDHDGRMFVYFLDGHDRQIYLDSIMRYGIPSPGIIPHRPWINNFLIKKNPVYIYAYHTLFMKHLLLDPVALDDSIQFWSDGMPKEGISGLAVFSRISMLALIRNKVLEYEDSNDLISFQPKKEIDFDIHEGGITLIQKVWREDSTLRFNQSSGKYLPCPWNKVHDYWLLAGIFVHGYAAWKDIISDERFRLLRDGLIQLGYSIFRNEMNEIILDNQSLAFLLHRLRILEQALCIEFALFNVCWSGANDGLVVETFNEFDLHDEQTKESEMYKISQHRHIQLSMLLKKQGSVKQILLPKREYSRTNVKKQIDRLQVLIEDIYSDMEYLPVFVMAV